MRCPLMQRTSYTTADYGALFAFRGCDFIGPAASLDRASSLSECRVGSGCSNLIQGTVVRVS